jgi:hypothetical protein
MLWEGEERSLLVDGYEQQLWRSKNRLMTLTGLLLSLSLLSFAV